MKDMHNRDKKSRESSKDKGVKASGKGTSDTGKKRGGSGADVSAKHKRSPDRDSHRADDSRSAAANAHCMPHCFCPASMPWWICSMHAAASQQCLQALAQDRLHSSSLLSVCPAVYR